MNLLPLKEAVSDIIKDITTDLADIKKIKWVYYEQFDGNNEIWKWNGQVPRKFTTHQNWHKNNLNSPITMIEFKIENFLQRISGPYDFTSKLYQTFK